MVFLLRSFYTSQRFETREYASGKQAKPPAINGLAGHELKFENQKLVANYQRMGYDPNGSWRIYKLRPDFNPADKVQVEDDINHVGGGAARGA
jgi:hypothetical protein